MGWMRRLRPAPWLLTVFAVCVAFGLSASLGEAEEEVRALRALVVALDAERYRSGTACPACISQGWDGHLCTHPGAVCERLHLVVNQGALTGASATDARRILEDSGMVYVHGRWERR